MLLMLSCLLDKAIKRMLDQKTLWSRFTRARCARQKATGAHQSKRGAGLLSKSCGAALPKRGCQGAPKAEGRGRGLCKCRGGLLPKGQRRGAKWGRLLALWLPKQACPCWLTEASGGSPDCTLASLHTCLHSLWVI